MSAAAVHGYRREGVYRAEVPWWLRWVLTLGVVGIAVLAARGSFGHMVKLGRMFGERDWGWTTPVVIDGSAVMSSLSMIVSRRSGEPVHWAAAWTFRIAVTLSLAANIGAAAPPAGSPGWVEFAARGWAALPPVFLALTWELLVHSTLRVLPEVPAAETVDETADEDTTPAAAEPVRTAGPVDHPPVRTDTVPASPAGPVERPAPEQRPPTPEVDRPAPPRLVHADGIPPELLACHDAVTTEACRAVVSWAVAAGRWPGQPTIRKVLDDADIRIPTRAHAAMAEALRDQPVPRAA